jgi:hypothetical protein
MTDFYHINDRGERVTWETCTCWGCALERQMREILNYIDEKYKKTVDDLSHGGQLRLYPDEARRLQWQWGEERWRIVDGFSRCGWIGCVAPLVIVIGPEDARP